MPSEFKEKWNEMVSELIMDALPDFLDKYYLFVPMIHQLFLVVRDFIESKQKKAITDIAAILNLKDEKDIHDILNGKLKSIF